MRLVRAVPRSEERCGAASCFLLDYCVVAIAAASCTWAMGQGGALLLPGCSCEPRHGAVHLVRWLACRSRCRQRGSPGPEAARHQRRSEGARGSDERDISRQEATRYGAAAGALLGGACPSAI